MSIEGLEWEAAVFLIFCRVGTCLGVTPGFASRTIPAQARLFLAVAVSLAIAPLIAPAILRTGLISPAAGAIVALIVTECSVGAFIGLLAHCFYAALQFAGHFMAQLAGYGGMSAGSDASGEAVSEVGAMLSATSIVLVFVLDLHVEMVLALIRSFEAIPFGVMLDPEQVLDGMRSGLSQSLQLAVRLAGPFVVTAILVNFVFGLLNKVAPQVPGIFISVPFLLSAGLWILCLVGTNIVEEFVRGFAEFLANR